MCFVWIADLQQASCQSGTPTTPWDFIPSLGIGFLCGYLDTDQNLAQLQPSQEQPHKFSHQGKLSSLRDVPWPHCYLDIFIYITVAHGGWAETKVPSHSAHTVTLFLPHRAAAHNSHFTPRWGDLSRAPQPAARPKICQQGSVLQALLPWSLQSRVSVSFFFPTSGSLVRCATMCHCPHQRSSPAWVILSKLSLQGRFSPTKPHNKIR